MPGATLEELGLSSLERIEMMVALEEALNTTIDETAFSNAKTVADLERLAAAPGATATRRPSRWNFRRGIARSRSARFARSAQPGFCFRSPACSPGSRSTDCSICTTSKGPVIFAANHQSHMDMPVILAALPGQWRRRVATAMAKEFFKAHFFPEQYTRGKWFTNSLNYWLSAAFFNTFPLPQREAGARQTLRYAGELISGGFSVLIFPEGKRTEHGEIAPFRPGVGMMASRLRVPVIPVRLEGIDRVLHQTWKMATPGPVRVIFGAPMQLTGEDYVDLTSQVEAAVRKLGE